MPAEQLRGPVITPENARDQHEFQECFDAWDNINEQLFRIGKIMVDNPGSERAKQALLTIKKAVGFMEAGKEPVLGEQSLAEAVNKKHPLFN
ncbi:MAG: hypothetical protein US42_C0002G0078 [Candidatus Magasanikbacteria bacterium GW2011_GWC2_37_14]|uniref:Uncharacterized protein n=1 Tax=Candidatus Magasanikbacteria bacterium GW2011_GWC2_37_14 TaxID=1619046 RepID=A0A0G0GAK2_9BACT|nr:MAG: hypothetical protein US42_C0002G0078 [Candidatus Magasanikbacteria bacterium GW2011_GWC2_37_14]